jgi:hypothetical protein
MAYNVDEIMEPFWAEYSDETSGRDPLAIQNSSVVIYTKMIIGITNVTNRLRYNGFYCWIFEKIIHNISKPNSYTEQIRYLRRAELLLAYMMVDRFEGITGVSGSIYAARNISKKISLISGADWESKKEGYSLYWKFKAGVFGQYYSGVVRELRLVNHPQPELDVFIYTLTDKGRQLAFDYGANIPAASQNLFWNAVYSGEILREELFQLTPFALHIIPQTSKENSFYASMLLAEDDRKIEPTFHRRNTIKLILEFLAQTKDNIDYLPTSFLKHNYKEQVKFTLLPLNTASAWYLYEVNEIIHVVLEHFHACFLYQIDSSPTEIEATIQNLIESVEKSLATEGINTSNTTLMNLFSSHLENSVDLYEHFDSMGDAFKQGEYGDCLKSAIHTALRLFADCKPHIEQLKDFASLTENNFNRTGYAIELFEELIEPNWNLSISDYVKELFYYVINRHTFSSYYKTRVGQNLVHNYMIEETKAWRLRETVPNRTSPRLQNAVQYLCDVNWVSKNGKSLTISNIGIETLNRL